MAYASTAIAAPGIRIHMPMPKLRWPGVPPRVRAMLMMALMISPCFLSDAFGYCVQRIFYTADQMAARESPEVLLSHIRKFDVACPTSDMSAAEQGRWAEYAAQQGWPSYPQAGPGCFNPDRNLRGVLAMKVFMVACPTMVLSALDQRRWLVYAADHGWTDYSRAGIGCVDP